MKNVTWFPRFKVKGDLLRSLEFCEKARFTTPREMSTIRTNRVVAIPVKALHRHSFDTQRLPSGR
jgi:hypothetical protein